MNFFKKTPQPDVVNRVKTLDDAISELGEDHPFVKEYRESSSISHNSLVYMELRIITAALNEGWKPKFDEYRFFPYFRFYTQKRFNRMGKKKRANVWLLNEPFGSYVGLTCKSSAYVPTWAATAIGLQLSFKSRELAKYAGKQFTKLYFDFYTGK